MSNKLATTTKSAIVKILIETAHQMFKVLKKWRKDETVKSNKVEPYFEPTFECQKSSTPKFPRAEVRSYYENVNASYDSAYDSDEECDPHIGHLCQVSWIDDTSDDKESFDNAWNQTIESLITLTDT